jgi:hypothetical protein
MSRTSRRETVSLPNEPGLQPNSGLVEQLLRDSLNGSESAGVKRPWAIKGIDETTIQLCKLAARGRGMKINRWVAGALCQAAQSQFGHPTETTQVHGIDILQLLDRLSRLEGEVEALSKSHAAIVSAVISR